MAITQLARYKERMEAIENVFSWYGELLKDDDLVRLERNFVKPHEFPLYVNAFCENRNSLFEFLFQKGIEARPMNPPLHTAAYFGAQAGTFENAARLGSSMIGLPCGPDIQYEEVKQVVSAIDAWRAAQA